MEMDIHNNPWLSWLPKDRYIHNRIFSFCSMWWRKKKYQQVKIKKFWISLKSGGQEITAHGPNQAHFLFVQSFTETAMPIPFLWLPSSYKNRAEPLWKRTDSPQNLKYLLPGPSQKGLMILSLNNAEIKSPGERRKIRGSQPERGQERKRKLIERGKGNEIQQLPWKELETEALKQIFRVSLWNAGMYSLSPSEKALVKRPGIIFQNFPECICYFYWCQVLWYLPVVRRCWWNTGTIWGRSVALGLRGKVYYKGLLINAQKLTETTAPSVSPVPLHPGCEMTVDEEGSTAGSMQRWY